MKKVKLSGLLKGDIIGRPGEHPGFELREVTIWTDMSKIKNASELKDKRVLIEGKLELVNFTESGEVLILKASSVTIDSQT
jgi:hypothetical protein